MRFTQIDYDREMALVAIDPQDAPSERHEKSEERVEEIRAIARYTRTPDGRCEFGLTVEDAWQRRGLGNLLLEALEAHARRVGLQEIYGLVLAENDGMTQLLKRRDYRAQHEDSTVLRWRKALS